ncbi:MAG TPA: 23S rRNA (pseudouridine(1915)-N(3))-methyltransferase RlmH [Polyangiales bacterium]
MHVVAVGKIKERGIREAIDDYAKRIGRYAQFHEVELKDLPSDELIEKFAKAIPARARVFALEVEGRVVSSQALAQLVGRGEQDSAIQHLVFLIGGSYGLPQATSRAADVQLSLSALTLPHRLARLLLVEQIYRAFTILRGEPYSH